MHNRVILLVEDSPDDEELALLAIKKNKITNPIVVARNGIDALDYLFGTGAYAGRDPGITPQLILMDLQLPKMTGIEVLRCIRSNTQTALIPVIILTTSTQQQDLFESYSSHANSYIHKPVDFPKFVEIIGQLGNYWLNINQVPTDLEEVNPQWVFHSASY